MKADVARAIVRRRRWIAMAFVALALLLLPLSRQIADRLEVGAAAVSRSEATRVDALLASEFAAPLSNRLLLAVTGIPAPGEPSGLDVLRRIAEHVAAAPGVAAVLSYLDTGDPSFLGPEGTFVVVGLSTGTLRSDQVVPGLRRSTQALQADLRADYPALELLWTGGAAFDYDVRLTGTTQAAQAERRVLPIALALLFVVFGSVVAALCPIVLGGLGVGLSLGAAVLISPYWPMTTLLQNIVTMIGLGIGIDYTLLILSRFREEMSFDADTDSDAGSDNAPGTRPERAAAAALRTAGATVMLSGSAVAIGFAALLVVPATELRSIATGGLLVVGISVLLATLLLPGLLAWLGHRVEAGRLWRARIARRPSPRWLAWGGWVARHPVPILIVVGLPLVGLAWQARHISTDIPSGNWLPEHMESTRGAMALQRLGQSGIVQAIRVIVELPGEQTADTEAGWAAVLRLSREFEADERVSRVLSLPRLLGVTSAQQARDALVPPELRAAHVGRNGSMALIELIPRESASAGTLMRYVRELRRMDPVAHTGVDGARLLVGGLPAHNADYQDAVGASIPKIVLFVVLGSFGALLVGFRSLLGAFKAVALNLLSVAAAMGLTVLVFQQGYGLQWLGVAEPLDGLFPAVPVIVFCVMFGLSMDYEVFLLSRVAEGVRRGMSNREALVEGLARSGRVITSAALVMIVVFAGFAMGDFLIVKILGFSLAVAIVIDATLVRLAIGPALLQLGGDWNWWPGTRRRTLRDA